VGRLRVGVIGDPIAHSLSPAFQQPALDALGIPATYERWRTPLAELPARIESLRGNDVLGANVTVPNKEAVIPLLDATEPLAARVGAVNTILSRDGQLLGENTDVYGLAQSLSEVCPDAAERDVLLLGAGGAARGAVVALDELGVNSLTVANRRVERAQQMIDEIRDGGGRVVDLYGPDFGDILSSTGVLINATSLGWKSGDVAFPVEWIDLLPRHALVMDLTYRETPLLHAARSRGLVALDGLRMLVYQGARSLELWTGQPAPVDLMMRAVEEARAASS
jgi:shikimate dehydrogenase